ncbi:MAG: nickel pincer cofactor biosynthesis protein LarC [Treponema sp.]|jgi:uncharacterized protein (TIGR00299 family) protein|nr:nickel pincer cofactor biosynthesis protein LarC [Treponema sp.]
MKTLHFDCRAGISGDMCLGALVDLGVDPGALRGELEKLGIGGWELRFERDERGGITGTHAVVDLGDRMDHTAHDDHDHHGHEHAHDHEHNHHGHGHHHDDHDHAPHGHRRWKEIRGLIEGSGLTAGAKGRALDIFTRIAEAEAQVHGTEVDEVAFHEVGALDSIIDIVGAAVCLDLLRPERVTCGEVELGGGTVRCAHGVLPVPAPATLILVRGMPVRTGGFDREMTTPTGAAILAASVDEFISPESAAGVFRELKTGYGIGTRRMERPNLLRVSWRSAACRPAAGEGPAATLRSAETDGGDWLTETLTLMEANIDDMTGEALAFLMECLFAAGALDVTLSPCVMKKSRPGTVVSVLAGPGNLDALRRVMFTRSSTIGFRETELRRLSLARETEDLPGVPGGARRKTVFLGGKALRSKIEFEDRARIAGERGISLDEAERIMDK